MISSGLGAGVGGSDSIFAIMSLFCSSYSTLPIVNVPVISEGFRLYPSGALRVNEYCTLEVVKKSIIYPLLSSLKSEN